jgi:hypothetical protein
VAFEEDDMRKRTVTVAAVMAVLLVPLLAVPVAAHGEHKVANYTFVVGFGTEPGYAGQTNSVQLMISNNGKPVTDARGLKAAVSTGDACSPTSAPVGASPATTAPSSSRPRRALTPSRSPAPSAARRSTRATPPARTASTRSPTRPRSSTRRSSQPAPS